jgi:hypothetical protein
MEVSMLKRNLLALTGAALLALPGIALSQSEQQLIERYTDLAGSEENATSLVTGLRDGKEVTLTEGTSTVMFTPKTGKMGWGNVDNAIAIAERLLQDQGITDPTPAQLEAAMTDVLKLRADGMGWGEIAHAYGFKLGEVKRAERAQPQKIEKAERVAKVERPVKPERPERPVRPERPEKPERPGKGR